MHPYNEVVLTIPFSDEVLFRSHIHPEQYSNTFGDAEIDRLHDAIMYIVDTAIANDADKTKFPKDCTLLSIYLLV
jgi:formamidopyrimidine-DNA glycosylase